MEPRELVAELSKLQEDFENDRLTNNGRLVKRALFEILRSFRLQLEYERITKRIARKKGQEPRMVLPWSEDERAAIQEAILLRHVIAKRAAELNKKKKEARSHKRKQAT